MISSLPKIHCQAYTINVKIVPHNKGYRARIIIRDSGYIVDDSTFVKVYSTVDDAIARATSEIQKYFDIEAKENLFDLCNNLDPRAIKKAVITLSTPEDNIIHLEENGFRKAHNEVDKYNEYIKDMKEGNISSSNNSNNTLSPVLEGIYSSENIIFDEASEIIPSWLFNKDDE